MWDVFISHASEDKAAVRPIVEALRQAGLSVWFDEQTLKLGDSLRQKIDEGPAKCSFGVVVLSDAFLSKEWPQKELDGLQAREDGGQKVILPVWHEITAERIRTKSPILASKLAVSTAAGRDAVVKAILDVVGAKDMPQDRGKVLCFADEMYSDIISVKFAVSAYKKGEKKFSIMWPETTELYLNQLRKLLSEAENYRSIESRFQGVNPEFVYNFVESGENAISAAQPLHANASLRICHLLQGMDDFFTTSSQECALANYLTLANIHILDLVLYPFRLKILYEEFFPKKYESWYAASLRDNMAEIFNFQEPVYLARIYQLGEIPIDEYFWGPKSMVLDSKDAFSLENPATISWFKKYLIPQKELMLAAIGSNEMIVYDSRAKIDKVLPDAGDEF